MTRYVSSLILIAVIGAAASAQTTEFTFQGSLKDGATLATGNYDFEFALFNALAAGGQIGATLPRNNVVVTNGIFSVRLDFGSQFPGANRFMEIRVRQAGAGVFTTLTPRSQINSSPYSVKSLNSNTSVDSQELGGLDASQYVVITDPRLTDARNPLPGSASYVQNQNAGPQTSSNFNISGTGTANIFAAGTQFNIGVNRVFSVGSGSSVIAGIAAGAANTGGDNSFFGRDSGGSNTSGFSNSFFGRDAGFSNTTGDSNSFFGRSAGAANTASHNAFFGRSAGSANTIGGGNAFFGSNSGLSNTTGSSNSFFGRSAGANNIDGNSNTFFGNSAGLSNTTADNNSFFGTSAGFSNTTGTSNVFFGTNTGFSNTSGNFNTVVGEDAGKANTTGGGNSFLGRRAGRDNLGSINAFFGNNAGLLNTTGNSNSFFGSDAGLANTTGGSNSFFGRSAGNANTTGINNTAVGASADVGSGGLTFATAIGAGATVSASNTVTLGRPLDIVRVPGSLASEGIITTNSNLTVIGDGIIAGSLDVEGTIEVTLGAAGATDVCRNPAEQLSTCASSFRYKSDVQPFAGGLNVVRNLRPIIFRWNHSNLRDVGFGAEDVEKVEPLLITRNDAGEIEGVKYKQITTVLVNAVKEQQLQIEAQQKQITALTQALCSLKSDLDVCKQQK